MLNVTSNTYTLPASFDLTTANVGAVPSLNVSLISGSGCEGLTKRSEESQGPSLELPLQSPDAE